MQDIAANNYAKQKKKKDATSRFPNGQIYIALAKNTLSYFPGDEIKGSVLVQ